MMKANGVTGGGGGILGRVATWTGGVALTLAAAAARAADVPTSQPAAASPTPAELADQIRDLQDKVRRLEQTRPAALPAAAPPAEAADRLARQRRGDADPMSSFKPGPNPLAAGDADVFSGVTGGWNGNQFVLRSGDGNFTFHPGVIVDVRDMLSYREHVPAGGGGSELAKGGYDTQNGVDISRLRLLADGTLFHQVSYLVQFAADQGAGLTLYDAVATYQLGRSPFSVKAGQFKDPVWHERNLSEAYLLAVDRSLNEQFLGGGQGSRVQGGAVTYDEGRTRAQLVAHDGFNSQNTKFFDAGGVPSGVGGAAGVTPTNFGFSTRAEYMLIGDRTPTFNPYLEYDQLSSLHARQDILVVGGGADYSQAGANDVILHSADIQYNQAAGFSAFGAYYGTWRKIDTNQGVSPPGSFYTYGFEAQAAYLLGGHFEPFARYELIHFNPSALRQVKAIDTRLLQQLTVGATYYIYGQKLKLTADASYLPDGSPADADAQGVLKDSGNNELVFRAQLQLAI